MADDTPQKGQAAPLEGALGRDTMMVLGICFASMSLRMCQGLAMTMGNAMSGPLLANDLANIGPAVNNAMTNSITGGIKAAPVNPFLAGPKMGTPFG